MKRFELRLIGQDGKSREETLSARSEEELLGSLREKGLTVINIREVESKSQPGESRELLFLGIDLGVSRQALTFFTRQLAITLNAGLPITRIISTIFSQSKNKSLRKVLSKIGSDLQQGHSLSEAMKNHPRVFGKMYLSMISIGETSGTLPSTVKKLAGLMEKDAAIRRKIRSAMAYPTFIIIFSIILTYFLLAIILPGFEPVFNATGLDIAKDYPLTKMLLSASAFCTNPVVVGGLIAILILALILQKFVMRLPRFRYLVDYIKFNFPFMSELVRMGAATRFSRSFATLTESGVPLLRSLSLVSDAAGNVVVSSSIQRITRDIQEGTKISETMKRTGIFPDLVIQMVAIGEESGTVPEMLEKTAEYFDSELETLIESLTSLLEPATMVAVGVIVGVFIMGILLPILGLTSRL